MKDINTTPRVKHGRRKSLKGGQAARAAAYVVSTLAGNGNGRWLEGTGAAASLNAPRSIAVTPSGSIVVAEANAPAIRIIAQNGVTSTLAGPRQISSLGSQDGRGSNVSFYQPNAMACARDGTVYTADSVYHLIRRIMPDGTSTTIAGTGRQANTDGVGLSASFNRPQSVALNPAGNILYVGDGDNQMVRRISIPDFTVTTFCSQVLAMGIAVGTNGVVYMACNDHRIYSLPVGGGGRTIKPPVFVGDGNQRYSDGQGTGCSFNQPKQLAIDGANNLYLADSGNNMIRMITPTGVVTTVVGNQNGGYVDGLKAAAQFNYPWGVAVDTAGNIFVGDTNNNRVRKLSLIMPPTPPSVKLIGADSISATISWTGGTSAVPTVFSYTINGGAPVAVPTTVTGPPLTIPMPSAGASFNVTLIASNDAGSTPSVPEGQAGGGALAVTTAAQMKSSTYTFVGTRGNAGSVNGVGTLASLNSPSGVTVDVSGNAYIVDTNNHCIRKVTPYGLTTTFAGTITVAGYVDNTLDTAQFRNPRDIDIDRAGNMYVADTGNNVIRKISALGVVTTFAGNTSSGSQNGMGPAADFNNPTSVTCDPSGNVFVTDTNNHCIRKITPAGLVTTFAGTNTGALMDGTGAEARFNSPSGIVYDDFSRNLYVADTNNHCIRSITLNGRVTTLAGNNTSGMTNGIGTLADFNGPIGIVTDAAGYIYVSDSSNHIIRKVAPGGLVSTYSGSSQGWADGTTTPVQFNSIQSSVQHNTPLGMTIDASGNLYVTETGNHVLRIITPNPRPVPPTSITIGSITTDSATINWSGGSGAKSFTFAMFPPTPGIVIPVVESSPATITGLTDGARYTVYVVSINAAGPILSNPFTFVTMISSPVVTVGPKDAIVTNNTANNPTPGDATALIRWTGAAVADSITYTISPNDLQNRSSVRMPNNQMSPFLITNIRPSTNYTLSLTATKANVQGANPSAYTASSTQVSFRTPPAQTVTVYPIAGIANNRGRTNDISGAKSTFDFPRGIAMDGNGVLYVTDRILIRKISGPPGTSYVSFNAKLPGAVPVPLEKTPILPGPIVKDHVGSRNGGQPSYSPSVGANARFYNIYGLTFDPFSGSLYATDWSYHYIIKITPGSGEPTAVVVAGNSQGYVNGTGNGANFNNPQGICAGKNGMIYIADCNNNCIRMMTPSGSVTTVAGPQPRANVATNTATNGPASTVGFNMPIALAADGIGNIYIADRNNHCIRYLNNTTSTVTTIAGGGQNGNSAGFSDGQGINAFFRNPCGLALDASGNLYVYDAGNYRIRRITPTGYVTTVAGNGSSGSTFGAGNNVSMSSNMDTEHNGLCSDGLGNIYFADCGSAMVKLISTVPKPIPSNHPSIAAYMAEQERLREAEAAAAAAGAEASQAAVVASQAAVVASQAKKVASQAEASQALQAASQAKVLELRASQATQVASQAAQVASSALQQSSQAQASQAAQVASSALQQSSQAQVQASQAGQVASSALQQSSQAQASQAAQVASQAAQTASSALQQSSQAQASQARVEASQALQVASQAYQAASAAIKAAVERQQYDVASQAEKVASAAIEYNTSSQALQVSSQAQASQAGQVASAALQQSSQAQASSALQRASSALQQSSQAQASSALQQSSQAQASQAGKVASAALQQSSQAQASQALQVASSAVQQASQAEASRAQASQALQQSSQAEASQAQASQALLKASAALQESSRLQASMAVQESSQAQASQAQASHAQASQAMQVASSARQQGASSALQVASQAEQVASQAEQMASQAGQVASSALRQSSQAQASQAQAQASQAQVSSAQQAEASQAAASQALKVASQAQVSQAQASTALQVASQAEASQALQLASQAYLAASAAIKAAVENKQYEVASQAEKVASAALEYNTASQAGASQALQVSSQAQAQASQAAQFASSALQQTSQAEASRAQASQALQQSSQAQASQAGASQALQQSSQAAASQAAIVASQAVASQAGQAASQAALQASQALKVASQAEALQVSEAIRAQAYATEEKISGAQASQAALQASQAAAQASQAAVQASQAAASQAVAVQASTAHATNLASLTNSDVATSSTAATAIGNSVQAQVAGLTATGDYDGATKALTDTLQSLRSSAAFTANDPSTVSLVNTLTTLQNTTITTNPNLQASSATEASAIVTDVVTLQGSNPAIYPAAAADIKKIATSQVSTLLSSGSYVQAANTLSSMIAQIMGSTAFKTNSPDAVNLVNSLAVMKQNAIAADPSTSATVKASQAALAVQQIQAAAVAIQAATGATPGAPPGAPPPTVTPPTVTPPTVTPPTVTPPTVTPPTVTPPTVTPPTVTPPTVTPAVTDAAPAPPAVTGAAPVPPAVTDAAPAPPAVTGAAPAPPPTGAAPAPPPETGTVEQPAADAEVFILGTGYGDQYGDTQVLNEGSQEVPQEDVPQEEVPQEEVQEGGKGFRKSRRRVRAKSRVKSRTKSRTKSR